MTDIQRGMQPKTVKREIKKKLEEWVSTIDDPEVRELVEEDTVVTGGSIASMLMGERVNDFDIYFRTKDTVLKVAEYYVKKFNELNPHTPVKPYVQYENITNIRGETEERVVIVVKSSGVAGEVKSEDQEYEYFEITDTPDGDRAQQYIDQFGSDDDDERPRYRPVFLSQNAITLSNKMQLVIRFWGEPDEIHDNYDFVHATSYYDWGKKELVTPAPALTSMMSRTLKYNGSLYPICSLFRIRKFMDRGWKISAGEILKIAWQVSEIDMTDHDILREQLTGIDQAYFHQLIKVIESYQDKAKEEGRTLEVDSTYVGQLIDEIFG